MVDSWKTIFLCEDTPDSIFTAVYNAWASRLGHENVRLEINGQFNYSLFSQYKDAQTDYEKSQKVARSVRRKLSPSVFDMVYGASLSNSPEKADAIYRFLVLAFQYGSRVTSMFGQPEVQAIFEMHRKTMNEAHLFREFTRFSCTRNGLLYGKISPKCNVLPFTAMHFADRFPSENWILLDETRAIAAFHPAGQGWQLASADQELLDRLLSLDPEEDEYRGLWKTFFDTIAVEARKNPRCQRNNLPLWYRKNMTEFSSYPK